MKIPDLEQLLSESKNNVAKLQNVQKSLEKLLRTAIYANEIAGVSLTSKLKKAQIELKRFNSVLVKETDSCKTFLTKFKE